MTTAKERVVVSTWTGTFLSDAGSSGRVEAAPTGVAELQSRVLMRLKGQLTPEDLRALEGARDLMSRDRRFAPEGVRWSVTGPAPPAPPSLDRPSSLHREVLLGAAAESLRAAWDPSLHVEEAVRAGSDLDRILNLLAERLASWAGRDTVATETGLLDHPERTARAIVDGSWGGAAELPSVDPVLLAGRRAVARLYLDARTAREELEAAVATSLPSRAPNLSKLLGPELAARLISQAGGVERLARLPASTVQVLGAERAFFEHLRGRGTSPRHGLLFLHPSIQSARRPERGRLARALAGKTAIAARLDAAGTALRPELSAQYERRAAEIRASPRKGRASSGHRSRPPLDRAPQDR